MTKKIKVRHHIDIIVLIAWTLLTSVLVVLFQAKPWLSTFFYFVLPTIYLRFRGAKFLNNKKLSWGGVLIGVVITYPFYLLAVASGAWSVPDKQLLIPIKLFGVIHVEEVLWHFFLALYTITFYEYFIDDERRLQLSRKFGTALRLWGIAALIPIVFFLIHRPPYQIPYAYAIVVAFFAFPPVTYLFLKHRLKLIGKFTIAVFFFFFVAVNFELTGVYLQQWIFNGEYIGSVTLFGITFPFEEFFYWLIFHPISVLSYYELFTDDGK